MDRTDLYNHFYHTFEQAILDAVKPNMFFTLSGGWDTRVIAGVLAQNNIYLPTVTWGDKLERLIASKIASILKFEHYIIVENLYSAFRKLKQKGCEYLLSGGLFDEINGSWTGTTAKTFKEFEYAQKIGLSGRYRYLEALRRTKAYPEYVFPVISPSVIKSLDSMPWQFRKGKQIQRWILKTKFPKLWHIPYSNSLLPSSLPFQLHGLVTIGLREVRK